MGLRSEERSLLAEGFLVKRAAGGGKRRHFFLFTDILVWGSVLRENINYIRQRVLPISEIIIEDIEDSNMWTITTTGPISVYLSA